MSAGLCKSAAVAIVTGLLLFFLNSAARSVGVGAPEFAQQGLPGGEDIIGPLRRGANGEIEVINPTREKGISKRACEAGVICVGKGQTFPTLAAALAVAGPKGVIEVIGGTYRESDKIVRAGLTIRGIEGTPHFDCTGLSLAEGKACLVLAAPDITLENLEISGAVLPGADGNGSCIRNEANIDFTVRRVFCHDSQEGILAAGGTILIENSVFAENGWSGQTHNVYFSGNCVVTVRGSTFRDARVGHEFKSRCRKTEISDSTFRSTKGSRDLDIPDGGETMVYRSTLVKTAGAQSEEIVGFTAESCRYPADMWLKDVRIVNSHPRADIRNFDKCAGHAIVLDHVTFEGTPVEEFGYILKR